MATKQDDVARANRRTLGKLGVVAVAMFGFGYALVPLYNVFCDLTGIRFGEDAGRANQAQISGEVDTSRVITVVFTGSVMKGLPWRFDSVQKKLQVHPGEVAEVKFLARNVASETIIGQAIPSVSPPRATAYFKKTECFCFSQQELKAGETKEMPVRFIVDTRLPREVETLTLSYAFFNTNKVSTNKYAESRGHVASVQHAMPVTQADTNS
jgi:cytochrome c oxidase assembly protein subunit 11